MGKSRMVKQVVITGIGAASPNGIGCEEFKQSLLNGTSGIRRIQAFDPSSLSCQIAGEVQLHGNGFSKKENRNLPRVTRLALLAAAEAFLNASFEPQSFEEKERWRFGALIGSGGGSAEFTERHYQMLHGKIPFQPSLYAVPASTAGSISSELSIHFGLLGRSHVITTGCTSSTDALGYAFEEIRTGRLDMVLAGGSDAPVAEGILRGFEIMKILPTEWNDRPEQASRPFSKNRSGFVLSEGAWMFVLEEKERALARGALILAELTGYGSSCEAFHAVRLEENGFANFRAMSLALEEAGVPPEEIDYVNLHGTSTPLNDRVETSAMKHLFGARVYQIPMSSTKSMIGHPQGASGAAGLAATILAMPEDKIHPTVNLEAQDEECDLDYVPNTARSYKIRYALLNTLGFGSKCSSLVIKNETK